MAFLGVFLDVAADIKNPKKMGKYGRKTAKSCQTSSQKNSRCNILSDIAPRTLNIAGAQTARASRSAAYVFSVGKHARLCGSPYENKRPPFGGLLFWQGHKGSNSGHAVLETAALPTELYP